jgi:prepilin-type processing-associated H-X9-DG protein
MPAVYSYPGIDGSPLSQNKTAYFVFTGEGTALGPPAATAGQAAAMVKAMGGKDGRSVTAKPAGPMIMDITDGVSNTILLVESKRDIPWTKPEDIPFDPNRPSRELEGFHESGFNAAFADGSVRFISKSIDQTVLKALITRSGGEWINVPF